MDLILPLGSISHDLFDPGEPVWSKILRTAAVYLALLVLLRLGGKRELGQLSALDLVVLLLLSNTVQNAVIGDDLSLTGGVIGAVVLIVLDKLLSSVKYRFPGFARLIGGDPTPLIEAGTVQSDNLRRQGITTEELAARCRMQGIDHLEEVETATLEVNGTVTVRPRHPTSDERAQAEILARLATIEQLLRGRPPAGDSAPAASPAAST
jgi:uncharacterized membrane protein YcaP (DUF421 family)